VRILRERESKSQKRKGELAMSFGDNDFSPQPPNGVEESGGFWRGFARRLDGLFAYPAKHAVSEQ
jgi:hypothetical protein